MKVKYNYEAGNFIYTDRLSITRRELKEKVGKWIAPMEVRRSRTVYGAIKSQEIFHFSICSSWFCSVEVLREELAGTYEDTDT